MHLLSFIYHEEKMTEQQSTLLVTGAGGQLGQRVLHHLLDTLKVSPERIIAASRNIETLSTLAHRGVVVRRCDFDDPASMAGAFHGVDRVLLISTDVLDEPGRRLAQHRAAIAAAEKAGVRHVVYTSMPAPEGSPIPFATDHLGTETALAASTLPGWSVLRNHWYYENLLMSLPHILATGQWHTAAGEGGIAHIARDDLAKAAAVALATGSGKHTYTLSGSRAYTTEEMAGLLGKAAGKPIQVNHVPLAAIEQGMMQAGLPEILARTFASFDTNTALGRCVEVTGDFKALTGDEPQPFEQWVEAQRDGLRNMAAG